MTVVVEHLSKSYGSHEAVRDISFTVPAGSMFAFLGANGAGKSTTIGCITTTLAPTAGRVTVAGADVTTQADRARAAIGVVFQSSLLDPSLTVRENLASRAGFHGLGRDAAVGRIAALSDLVELEEVLDRRYGRLSGGQRRRADIARALLHDPEVLFLDEPTAGLDPQSRERIWAVIARLREYRGTTVFLTTHYLEETERADDVRIVAAGRIVAEGTPDELRSRHAASVLTVRTADPDGVLAACARLGVTAERRTGGDLPSLRIPVASAAQAQAILAAGPVDDFEFRHGTMDDVFLAVAGEVAA